MQPLLSIVIPTYNGQTYIEETIESALSQTWTNYEVVIVDDASSDRTPDILRQFASHPNVRLFFSKTNRTAPKNYNTGVLLSQGSYLTFLDQDDLLEPSYCEKVIDKMESENADIGFANLYALADRTRKTTTLYGQPREPKYDFVFGGPDRSFPTDAALLRKMMLQAVHISPRSIYKKGLFAYCGLDDARLPISLDWLRHILFILHGAKCTYLDEPLGYYRLHQHGLSQKDPLKSIVDIVKTLEIVLYEYAALLKPEEVLIVKSGISYWRGSFFQQLALSDLNTASILSYLIDQRF